MVTATAPQFTSPAAFASHMIGRYAKSHLKFLNDGTGRDRLRLLVGDIERWGRWSLEDGGLEPSYNAAAYGLSWTLVTGRLNGKTAMAVEALNVREMCKLVHTLMTSCDNMGQYASFLMERYS